MRKRPWFFPGLSDFGAPREAPQTKAEPDGAFPVTAGYFSPLPLSFSGLHSCLANAANAGTLWRMSGLADTYDLLVFDLDGTLADTREDIATSINHALACAGRPTLSVSEVTRLVGDGARVLVERCLGPNAAPGEVDRILDAFVEHYRDGCTQTTTLYPGVAEALEGLAGKPLCVLTNKPEFHSRKILETLGVLHRFRRIVGGDGPYPKKPDPRGMLALVREAACPPSRALLVGDSLVDYTTARAAGAHAALVTYGFRPEAVKEASPEHVLERLDDLLRPPVAGGRRA